MNTSDWSQQYVAILQASSTSRFLVPLNEDDRPNPDIWKWTDRPKRGVKDYVIMHVSGTKAHHFSDSTKTWYISDLPEYHPHNLDVVPVKKTPKAIVTPITSWGSVNDVREEKEDSATHSGPKFSSLETFYT